jgi:hypothetical protein
MKIKNYIVVILAMGGLMPSALAVTAKKTSGTVSTPSQSFGCNGVYPTEVNCPAGYVCELLSPICIINIKIGGSSITEELYSLTVATNEFIPVALTTANSVKLPLSDYPALGKRAAFQITPVKGDFTGVPFNIVVQSELPTDAFINKIAQGLVNLKDPKQIESANALLTNLKNLKTNNQGINAIYRIVPGFGEKQYKLYHVRAASPGDTEAIINITPTGNLQFFENSDQPGKKKVTEIDTGVLSK